MTDVIIWLVYIIKVQHTVTQLRSMVKCYIFIYQSIYKTEIRRLSALIAIMSPLIQSNLNSMERVL